jgi:hypothetical protein
MAYSLAYLVVGLAIALWGVIVRTVRGPSADYRIAVLFVYLSIGAAYQRHSVFNEGRNDFWLIPLRDFMSLAICVASLFGRRRTFR